MMQPSRPPTPPPATLMASPTESTPTSPGRVSESFQKSTLTPARWTKIIGLLLVASALSAVVCLQFGAEYIGLGQILHIFFESATGSSDLGTTATILFQLRLPRVFIGFLIGGCLASVGVALQALLRNPLADPYILGVSSGAALGVAIAVLIGVGTTMLAVSILPLCGFLGSLAALLVIYRLAASYDRLPIYSLLLAGVILNAVFSALIMFVTSMMDPNRSFGMMIWLMGSLTAPTYPILLVLSLYLFVGLALLLKQVRVLNVMAFGEESARSLGIDTERTKRYIFLVSALMTGAVVSVSGMIGFIGMVVPHAVRLMFGADHRLLMPAAGLVGGAFLMIADTFARTFVSPSEVPVGIMTALAGGPFFIYLLVWRKDQMS